MKTVIATGNNNKIREIRQILGSYSEDYISMKEAKIDLEIEEDGKTFVENALKKARCVKAYWEGTVIADDSGLVVDAMGGDPGIKSARFMGEDTPYEEKCKAILEKLEGVCGDARSARFVCAMVAILPDGTEICIEETMEGEVAKSPAGENGFGYDPIFIPNGYDVTNAQLDPEEKNKISHRGKALRKLKEELSGVKLLTKKMKENAPIMASLNHKVRIEALENIIRGLNKNKEKIFKSNDRDLEEAKNSGISDAVIKRLKFDEAKLAGVISGIETLAKLSDPLKKISLNRELSDDLILKRIAVPIGVIGVIFEARPDALVQIATLCIKSGNMCVLKGGKETENTNKALFDVIYKCALESGLPKSCLCRVSSHNEIDELLHCDKNVDLIIPRGSNEFVKYILNNTSIPVLGHADGICHTYVDSGADLEIAKKVCLDAKIQYPAACNAMETLLVAKNIADEFLPQMEKVYKENGVKIYGTRDVTAIIDCEKILDDDFRREYLDLCVSIKIVEDVKDAVEHINKYGSHHTDAIITNNEDAWEYFSLMVDSAGVYKNASTRFADGFRYGFGAEVGISTSKIHARGPVGLEGLVTYKYLMEGKGHTVEEFESGKLKYNFKDIN